MLRFWRRRRKKKISPLCFGCNAQQINHIVIRHEPTCTVIFPLDMRGVHLNVGATVMLLDGRVGIIDTLHSGDPAVNYPVVRVDCLLGQRINWVEPRTLLVVT